MQQADQHARGALDANVPGPTTDPAVPGRRGGSDAPAMTSVELLAAQRREASRRGRHRSGGGHDTIIWWHLANVIDVVHFPIVIGLVVLGAVYFSGPVFVFLLTLMVTLQVAVLGCPVMWLTGQLRKIHDPEYEVKWSFTAWLYQRYGRWFGIAVFCAFAGLTLLLRAWLF